MRTIQLKSFKIKQDWLGLGYICRYPVENEEDIYYFHDEVFQRNKKEIMANKTWRDPQKRCITTGPNRNIPYKGEIPLRWLPAEE